MKKHVMELLMACMMLVCFYYLSREAAVTAGKMSQSKVIVVDIGHGGADPGMIGVGGLEEKSVNLAIGLKVKDELVKRGFTVVLTRDKDEGLYEENARNKKAQDLQKRISIIEETSPLLCVSIHQNSYQDPNVRGPQVFYYRDSAQGKQLAELIQEQLNTVLEVSRPRVAKDNTSYYLLKRSKGVLNIVECGFLTNPEEAVFLQEEKYQKKVAEAVAKGIEQYLAAAGIL